MKNILSGTMTDQTLQKRKISESKDIAIETIKKIVFFKKMHKASVSSGSSTKLRYV